MQPVTILPTIMNVFVDKGIPAKTVTKILTSVMITHVSMVYVPMKLIPTVVNVTMGTQGRIAIKILMSAKAATGQYAGMAALALTLRALTNVVVKRAIPVS